METTELQRRFGAAVRRRRLRARIGQEALADQAGIHRTHVSLIERGEGVPTLLVIHKLAESLGVSMAQLMADVESDTQPDAEPPPLPRGRPKQGQHGAADEPEAG